MKNRITIIFILCILLSCQNMNRAVFIPKEVFNNEEVYYNKIEDIDTTRVAYFEYLYEKRCLICKEFLHKYDLLNIVIEKQYIFYDINDMHLFIVNNDNYHHYILCNDKKILRSCYVFDNEHLSDKLFKNKKTKRILNKNNYSIDNCISSCINTLFSYPQNEMINYSYTFYKDQAVYDWHSPYLFLFNSNGKRLISYDFDTEKATVIYYKYKYHKDIFRSNGALFYLGFLLKMEF